MRYSSIFSLIPQNNVTKESLSKFEKSLLHEGLQVATLRKKISDGLAYMNEMSYRKQVLMIKHHFQKTKKNERYFNQCKPQVTI
jgi:hypothetical protein